MPFGDPFQYPEDGSDPLFDQKHGGWLVNNPGTSPSLGGGAAGGGSPGFYQQSWGGGPTQNAGFVRRRQAGSVFGRQATPMIGNGRGWLGGGRPSYTPTTTPTATPAGGSGINWGDVGSWDIPQWNRMASLVAAGDPSLFGTAFDPRGNPYEMRALGDYFSQEGLNRERQAVVGADMSAPNDPWLRAIAMSRARAGAMSDSARAQAAARLQAVQAARQRGDAAFQSILGANLQHGLNTQGALNQQYAQERNQPGFWDYLSQLGGAALGGWASGGFQMPKRNVAGGGGGLNPNWWGG